MSMSAENILRKGFYGAFGSCILLDGGAHYFGSSISCVLFGGIFLGTVAIEFHRRPLKEIRRLAILATVAIAVVALVQSGAIPFVRWEHPSWVNLSTLTDLQYSTAPAANRLQPLWEVPKAILPFIAVAAAVPLFRSARESRNAWVSIMLLGSIFALYGFVQKLFFPEWHFFFDRDTYVDSLTGFYINRNAAAAFLFLTSSASLSVLNHTLERLDPRVVRSDEGWRYWSQGEKWSLVTTCAMVALQMMALLATRSRFGFAYIVLALVPIAALTVYRFFRRAGFRVGKREVVVAAVLAIAFVGTAAEQVLFRLEVQGADDENRICIYGSVLSMIKDNILIGAGLGTFVDAFPPYKRPECGLFGVWETAHDTYLEGLATMGLVFVPFLLLVVVGTVRALRIAYDCSRSSRLDVLMVAAAGGMLGLHSLVDFPLEIPANAIVYGLMVVSVVGRATDPTRRRGARSGRSRREGRYSDPSLAPRNDGLPVDV